MAQPKSKLDRHLEKHASIRRHKPVVDLGPLLLPSVFQKPRFLLDGHSCHHIPFLFWLTEAVRPEKVMCLGRGTGEALLSICQVVDQLSLGCRCEWLICEDQRKTNNDQFEQYFSNAKNLLATHYLDIAAIREIGIHEKEMPQGNSTDIYLVDLKNTSFDAGQFLANAFDELSPRGILLLFGCRQLDMEIETVEAIGGQLNSDKFLEFSSGDGLVVLAAGGEVPPLLSWLMLNKSDPAFWPAAEGFFERLGKFQHSAFQLTEMEKRYAVTQDVMSEIKSIRERVSEFIAKSAE